MYFNGADVQRHNEEKLNAAFRAGSTVLLVFSVNMSGHFQGYAKMQSMVSRQRVSSVCFGLLPLACVHGSCLLLPTIVHWADLKSFDTVW